jgi:Protein of unknown function (DUF5661)
MKRFTISEATLIGDALGIRWNKIDIGQFTVGLTVELQRMGPVQPDLNDATMRSGKIVLAHLMQTPHYYTRMVR